MGEDRSSPTPSQKLTAMQNLSPDSRTLVPHTNPPDLSIIVGKSKDKLRDRG
jgi:hypothetical protein